ncbi:sorting nexin-15 isoform X3 [Manis pentadactyla]|uniref:sorting nexin-15 isoform X3 n=1 Tax=Manis pentadactyla TaxID=143292 RepID=UPI00255CE933|nr:sorting nexin-15 isoform X3 [Manis pentadactyla]
MSRQAKDDFLRHYTVSDPRNHPKGYTEYKVTAQFISKRDPEDVKEVVVWKRYSDFRKLHGDLAYTHRNLFRRLEEFPAFPRAQVFGKIAGQPAAQILSGRTRKSGVRATGLCVSLLLSTSLVLGAAGRFEASVIEERRKGAEDLLRFTVHIPALNNSPQLKEFFQGGEVTRPFEVSRDLRILPPPLIPTLPPDEPRLQPEEPWLPQLLPAERRGLEELEVPVDPLPSSPAQEALDLLFNCGSIEEASSSPAQGHLTDAELALFDPFSKEGDPSPARREGVKKKAAEYLKRAEEILHLHLSQLPP